MQYFYFAITLQYISRFLYNEMNTSPVLHIPTKKSVLVIYQGFYPHILCSSHVWKPIP